MFFLLNHLDSSDMTELFCFGKINKWKNHSQLVTLVQMKNDYIILQRYKAGGSCVPFTGRKQKRLASHDGNKKGAEDNGRENSLSSVFSLESMACRVLRFRGSATNDHGQEIPPGKSRDAYRFARPILIKKWTIFKRNKARPLLRPGFLPLVINDNTKIKLTYIILKWIIKCLSNFHNRIEHCCTWKVDIRKSGKEV